MRDRTGNPSWPQTIDKLKLVRTASQDKHECLSPPKRPPRSYAVFEVVRSAISWSDFSKGVCATPRSVMMAVT